jgi:hypothetical protein
MDIKVEGKKLIVTLDLLDEGGSLSESEKNYVIGGTGGFKEVAKGFKLNVVLMRANTEYRKAK